MENKQKILDVVSFITSDKSNQHHVQKILDLYDELNNDDLVTKLKSFTPNSSYRVDELEIEWFKEDYDYLNRLEAIVTSAKNREKLFKEVMNLFNETIYRTDNDIILQGAYEILSIIVGENFEFRKNSKRFDAVRATVYNYEYNEDDLQVGIGKGFNYSLT